MTALAKHKLFKVNLNIVLRNNLDEILILKRSNKWMLPGGRLDENESWERGLRREVKEETGINDYIIEEIASVDISDSGSTFIVFFAGSVKNKPEVTLSHEHQDYTWTKIDSIDKYTYHHKKIKDRIKAVL